MTKVRICPAYGWGRKCGRNDTAGQFPGPNRVYFYAGQILTLVIVEIYGTWYIDPYQPIKIQYVNPRKQKRWIKMLNAKLGELLKIHRSNRIHLFLMYSIFPTASKLARMIFCRNFCLALLDIIN